MPCRRHSGYWYGEDAARLPQTCMRDRTRSWGRWASVSLVSQGAGSVQPARKGLIKPLQCVPESQPIRCSCQLLTEFFSSGLKCFQEKIVQVRPKTPCDLLQHRLGCPYVIWSRGHHRLSLQYGNGLCDLVNVILSDRLAIMSWAAFRLLWQVGYQALKELSPSQHFLMLGCLSHLRVSGVDGDR